MLRNMKKAVKIQNLIGIILLFLFITGCEENNTPVSPKLENQIQHEVGQLTYIMSLPIKPLKVKWQSLNNNDLTALFTYSEKDYQCIIDNSTAYESVHNVQLMAEFYRDWLKYEVVLNTEYHAE